MKKVNILFVSFFCLLFGFGSTATRFISHSAFNGIHFEENKGQVKDQFSKARPDVLFSGHSGNTTFHLRNNGVSYQMLRLDSVVKKSEQGLKLSCLRKKASSQGTIYRLDLNWLNSNANPNIFTEQPLEGCANFYSEICPKGILGVKSYKSISYQNLYKGINLKWYEKNGHLKYDYIVASGTDYKIIQIEIKGALEIQITVSGKLLIKTPLGEIIEDSPFVVQDGKKLNAKWSVHGNIVSFDIKGVDPTKTLIIDPLVRLWGTYFGDTQTDGLSNSCTDNIGNLYITGITESTSNIATSGAHQSTYGGNTIASGWTRGDAYLAKFSPSGSKIWCTYYGGDWGDMGLGCAANSNAKYVAMVGTTGSTLSGVIATPGSHQPIWSGGSGADVIDGFCVLFDSSGVRQWGTYYGGSAGDYLYGCCFDKNDNLFLTGGTYSSDGNFIATSGSHQQSFGGYTDAFLAKFNISGTRLWATYYGATGTEYAESCVCDNSGNVYMVGAASSSVGISTPGCHQPNYGGGVNPSTVGGFSQEGDGMIVKFDNNGTRLWATYYGHTNNDWACQCIVNSAGDLFVAGASAYGIQGVISTPGSFQSTYGGGPRDAFLLKMNSSGVRQWCTFYGGPGSEPINYCSIGSNDMIYLTGITNSTYSITTPCSYQPNHGGGTYDCYLAKFDSNGSRFWATYYGGISTEDWVHCSADQFGNVFLTGETKGGSNNLLGTSNGSQPNYGGGAFDAFIAKFDRCTTPVNITPLGAQEICKIGDTIALKTNYNCGISWYNGLNNTVIASGSLAIVTPSVTQTYYIKDSTCGTIYTTAITVTVNSYPDLSVTATNTLLCFNTDLKISATGATTYSWSPNTSISCTTCNEPIVSPKENIDYCVTGANGSCKTQTCIGIVVNSALSHDFSLPNALSPNGDGINDNLCLQGWELCNDSFLMRIFDRWGEKVFESTDPNFCWDGTFNGKLLSADVFVYSVSAKYKDDTKVNKKGSITLIR